MTCAPSRVLLPEADLWVLKRCLWDQTAEASKRHPFPSMADILASDQQVKSGQFATGTWKSNNRKLIHGRKAPEDLNPQEAWSNTGQCSKDGPLGWRSWRWLNEATGGTQVFLRRKAVPDGPGFLCFDSQICIISGGCVEANHQGNSVALPLKWWIIFSLSQLLFKVCD